MKTLFKKLLCALFLHDFYTEKETDEYTETRCTRCPGAWRVDNEKRTMEPVAE